MQMESNDLARLRSQMSRAELVLFTGAGFSLGAKSRSGSLVPSASDLKEEIWKLCYPSDPFDPSASLGDLYAAGLRRHRSNLVRLLETRLSVDPDSLPDYYRSYFDTPWLRCYTLNVDDLDSAVSMRFALRRPLLTVSATVRESTQSPASLPTTNRLEVVHLNGLMSGPAESLTFSESQYAERIASQEPWYSRCAVDLLCRPVIFIGTVLSESLLWHHIELRRRRDSRSRDLRPTSILISKDLSLPRREILKDLRIDWIQGTAREFAEEVLPLLGQDITRGFVFLGEQSPARAADYIPLVSQLAAQHPTAQTEYLLGDEPRWADLITGRAAERSNDRALLQIAEDVLAGRVQGALAVTGTAGTGKSTALMRLVLQLSNKAIPVLWIDKDSLISVQRMRAGVRSAREGVVLAIDDADLYGRELVSLIRDTVPGSKDFLLVFAVRSGKLDGITSAVDASGEVRVMEHVVPGLTDDDIDGLIATLDRNNRLGRLKGMSAEDRKAAFKEQAGRQLLVAMLQATSGDNFVRKAQDEFAQLTGSQRYVYSLASVATAQRNYLLKDEILLASSDQPNETLASLDRLIARHLIVASPGTNQYRGRHRVIADLVFDKLVELKELENVLLGLCWALASKIDINSDRHARLPTFLVRLMNHDFLLHSIGVRGSRDIYAELENILSWDYHYWLQRGSLEVEAGDVRLAENFLGSAYSLGSGDYRVQTAYGYMLMRKAWEGPHSARAPELLQNGAQLLEEVIEKSGSVSSYPYHVLGSQGLAWAHRADLAREDKREFLRHLLELVSQGLCNHRRQENLMRLKQDLEREILLTVVKP